MTDWPATTLITATTADLPEPPAGGHRHRGQHRRARPRAPRRPTAAPVNTATGIGQRRRKNTATNATSAERDVEHEQLAIRTGRPPAGPRRPR